MEEAETNSVYLSLGSNLGDREANLRAALAGLRAALEIEAVSSLYESDPVGPQNQSPFLNIAVRGRTELEPADLLVRVKELEAEIGRRPTYRWGPRVIDIDIILYGNSTLRTPDLIIPHPEMANRAFVLVPLAEIAPVAGFPVLGASIAELSEKVPGRETVRTVGRAPW